LRRYIKELKLRSKTGEYLVAVMDARILRDGMVYASERTPLVLVVCPDYSLHRISRDGLVNAPNSTPLGWAFASFHHIYASNPVFASTADGRITL